MKPVCPSCLCPLSSTPLQGSQFTVKLPENTRPSCLRHSDSALFLRIGAGGVQDSLGGWEGEPVQLPGPPAQGEPPVGQGEEGVRRLCLAHISSPVGRTGWSPAFAVPSHYTEGSWSPGAWGVERGEVGTELGPLAGLPAVLSRALAGIWLPSCSTKTTRSLFSLTSFLLLPGQQEISCALASPVADLKPSEGHSGEDSFPATPTTWPLSLVMTRGASFLPVPGSHCSLVYYVTNPPTSSLPTPLLPASKIGSQMMSRPMLHPCLAGYWPALLLVLKSTLRMGLPFTPAPVMQSPSALASLTPSYAPPPPRPRHSTYLECHPPLAIW